MIYPQPARRDGEGSACVGGAIFGRKTRVKPSIMCVMRIGNPHFWAKNGDWGVTNVQKYAQTVRKDLKSVTGLMKRLTENSKILRENM